MAEFTEDQLRQAARRAYEDGNIEAAQRLIAQARAAGGMQPQPQGGSSVNQDNLTAMQQGGRDMSLTGRAMLHGAGNGMSLGFGDNIAAAAQGVGGMLRGEDFGDTYRESLDGIRSADETIRDFAPLATTVGDVAGSVPAAVSGGALAQGGKTLIGQGTRLAGFGAAEGAVIGAGNSDGGDLLTDTAQGAGLGAVVGAAAKPVAAGLQATGRALSTPVAGLFNAVTGRASPNRANAVVQRAYERSGKTLEQLQHESLEAMQAGQPMIFADMLGAPGQGAITGVAVNPGVAQRELTEFLDSRQLDAGDRMSTQLADQLGAPDTAAQRRAALTQQRSDDADINYEIASAGASPVNLNGAIDLIDQTLRRDPILGETALSQGPLGNRLLALRNRMQVDGEQLVDFDSIRNLRTDIRRAMERNPQVASDLRGVYNQLDRALEASSDGFRMANDTYRAQSRAIDAVDQGQAATRPSQRADDVVSGLQSMPPEQRSAFNAGLANDLIGKIEGQATGANVALPLMRTRTASILDEAAQEPQALRSFIGRENTMAETRRQALGNSRTAEKLANMDDVQNVDVGLLANLLRGSFAEAATRGGQKVANVATNQNEATQQLLGRLLMSSDPEEALSGALRRQSASRRNNQIMQAIMRTGAQQALN